LAKQTEHAADHSSSSGVEVKNVWNFISTPQSIFVEWFLSTGTLLP
jgi:hypothetical protein